MLIKNIAILGSTGSIGVQALDVIYCNPKLFKVVVLTANNNYKLLINQAIKFLPEIVVIANQEYYLEVKKALSSFNIVVLAGEKSIVDVCTIQKVDIVLTAMVGFSGLIPTIQAIKNNKIIALANKETMVVAGMIINELLTKYNSKIIPVDSEHSAIFQCLEGEVNNKIEKIILTASGGPFREKSFDFIKNASINDALNHPIWKMGDKISIDSASMINKGLEAIEAKWLFNLDPNQIEIVVHPQSIIHSMVQFQDGSVKAQMSLPDMKMPIQYAFTYPYRLKSEVKRIDFNFTNEFNFYIPDFKKFRNLKLALDSINTGGNSPCVLNAANEIVVDAFLNNRITFFEMSDLIEKALFKINHIVNPTIDDLLITNKETREYTKSLIN